MERLGDHDGDVTVANDALLPVGRTVRGRVTVRGPAVLRVYGTINGELRVRPGGMAVVLGVVTGDVRNRGTLSVCGTVLGRLRGTGYVVIDDRARIGPSEPSR